MKFSDKTDRELRVWAANFEKAGKTDDERYLLLVEELARRTGRGLSVEKSLAHLTDAAKEERFTTYGEVAAASGVAWSKARHAMNGSGGHLDQLLSICHARGLPLLPTICVNQENATTGELAGPALLGFVHGVERLGYDVRDGGAFLRKCQQECFDWGRAADGNRQEPSERHTGTDQ